jgi:hypothetical protein
LLQTAAHLGRYWLDLEQAMEYGERSLALYQRLGNLAGCINTLTILRTTALLMGNERLGERYSVQALSLARDVGDQQLIFTAADELAKIAYLTGDGERFAQLEQECEQLSSFVSPPHRVRWMSHQVRVHCDCGRWETAWNVATEMESISRKHGLDYWLVTAIRERGYLALLMSDLPRATALVNESLSLSKHLNDPAQEGMTYHVCALVELGCGRPDMAHRYALSAVACLRDVRARGHLAIVLIGAGAAALGNADLSGAVASYSSTQGIQIAMAVCVYGIAACCARRGPGTDASLAARLCGAASALRHAHVGRYALPSYAMPLPDPDPARDKAIATCRAALGDDAFDAAWAAGMALSWEQVIDEALAAISEVAHHEPA